MAEAAELTLKLLKLGLTAAEVKHDHTIAMIAFEEYDWVTRNIAPRWPPL